MLYKNKQIVSLTVDFGSSYESMPEQFDVQIVVLTEDDKQLIINDIMDAAQIYNIYKSLNLEITICLESAYHEYKDDMKSFED